MDVLDRLFQLSLFGLSLPLEQRAALIESPPEKWSDLGDRPLSFRARAFVEDLRRCETHWHELDRLTVRHGLRWTRLGRDDCPPRLSQLSDPPAILCYRGRPVWTALESISIVGSREPMPSSLEWLRLQLLEFLQGTEVAVASGGARGIDRAAHDLALLAGRPTVCFLPSGILRPYPRDHTSLFERIIASGGAVVSGFPPEAEMEKRFFHTRNRWIAGISSVTLIVEARRRSGSHLTAKMAMDEGRAICTLPVSPTGAAGLANLDLIFAGAQMLRDHEDLSMFFARERRT